MILWNQFKSNQIKSNWLKSKSNTTIDSFFCARNKRKTLLLFATQTEAAQQVAAAQPLVVVVVVVVVVVLILLRLLPMRFSNDLMIDWFILLYMKEKKLCSSISSFAISVWLSYEQVYITNTIQRPWLLEETTIINLRILLQHIFCKKWKHLFFFNNIKCYNNLSLMLNVEWFFKPTKKNAFSVLEHTYKFK